MYPSLMQDQRKMKQPVGYGLTMIAILALLCALFLADAAMAAPEPVGDYPRIELTPSQPVVGDTVTLQLVLGLASSSCDAPTYTGLSAVITLVDTPSNSIDLHYTEVPPPPDRICPAVYDPTEYGPSYRLGALPAGLYSVHDGDVTVGRFAVTVEPVAKRVTIDGTVMEDTGPLDYMKLLSGVKVYLREPMEFVLYKSMAASDMIPTRLVDSAVTDQFGRFAFADIDTGSYMLSFAGSAHQGEWLWLNARRDTTVSVTLLPLGATAGITGTVTEACPPNAFCLHSPPIEGCTVSVMIALVMYKSQAPAPSDSLTAITDSEGRYAISGIPLYSSGAAYMVTARKAGYHDTTANPSLQYGYTATVDLALMPDWLTAREPASTAAHGRIASLDRSGRYLVLDLPRAGLVHAEAFDTRGRRLGGVELSEDLAAGRHMIDLSRLSGNAASMAVVRVRSAGFVETLRLAPQAVDAIK